jgi:glycosyltransferase involved in cell wall biosynthesis
MSEEKFIDIKGLIESKSPKLAKWLPGFVISYLKRILHQDEINDFLAKHRNDFDTDFFPDISIDNRVVFYGRTPRATVKEAFESSHIFVYPSVFEETFCLSMAEAMSAGALPVYSKIGSLEEIGNNYGMSYEFTENQNEHYKRFAENLQDAILKIKNNEWDPTEQIGYVNDSFSWDAIEQQWLKFNEIC